MFNGIDLTFFLGYFVLVVAIGFLSGRKQRKTVSGYFRGGNRLPFYAIGFSIVAAGISSEQFVGEVGYAYKLGMPVANWEWSVFPALSLLLWIFIPLYYRNRITTMPEYLERRFGGEVRTLYAILLILSYVLVNFAVVFYTGGYALEVMWGFPKLYAVWALALITGLYTIYGGLTAVAWTGSFQCILLMGGGLYVFFSGMNLIGWDFQAILGEGTRAHLITPADHEVPWTALAIMLLTVHVWYYANNQYINQRCLAARSEWHAKMGILVAMGLQILLPLATTFPGMVYRVINPDLIQSDASYPMMVSAVVPTGLRGLVAAAIVGAIMSTISGLVNSTSTLVTLDLYQRWSKKRILEDKLVRVGRWSGGIALLIGACIAPLVMKWENLFRYAQDIWVPMASPVVVVFLCAALWPRATQRGALACLWLSILTIPFIIGKTILADYEIRFLPENLENPLVFAGVVTMMAVIFMAVSSKHRSLTADLGLSVLLVIPIALLAVWSPEIIAVLVLCLLAFSILWLCSKRLDPVESMWDRSMLSGMSGAAWIANIWIWWTLAALIMAAIYIYFW
ncbi:MAG: sodium/solute symporter [Candidatus Omnitrophica bacterium]|nr:sodium/solute symporter [Candidatus Omnitrophota bacterium]